jgi:hypothetical protein
MKNSLYYFRAQTVGSCIGQLYLTAYLAVLTPILQCDNHRSRGRRGMHIGYLWERQKEREHWEDQDIGGWAVLKWILEK